MQLPVFHKYPVAMPVLQDQILVLLDKCGSKAYRSTVVVVEVG